MKKEAVIFLMFLVFLTNISFLSAQVHDVAIDKTYSNSIDGIKIEYQQNTTPILNDSLICNNKYKIKIRVHNRGDFTENLIFDGSVFGRYGNLSFDYEPTNITPNQKKEKQRTLNFTLTEGVYTIRVNINLNGSVDENLSNNFGERNITILCPGEELVHLYRCYKNTSGDHMDSLNADCGNLSGYLNEGQLGKIFKVQKINTSPRYSCFNSLREDHMLSRNAGCESPGYVNEGLLGYVYETNIPNTAQLNRCYHPFINDHLTSISLNVAVGGSCESVNSFWKNEGTLGWILR